MKRLLSGNQAIACAALESGIGLAAGYPGTPSTEALAELELFAGKNNPALYVEWSVNEKVAFELAAAAAWAGKRALVTMKMSGANVALDSLISVAHSGVTGGLVVYIADDPGAEAGMPEQDSRLLALLCGLPLLDPSSPEQAYRLARLAFRLSEECQLPVILRAVTSVAHAKEEVEAQFVHRPLERPASFARDIARYTKAGSAICLRQHRALLERLERAGKFLAGSGINTLLGAEPGNGLAVIGAGVVSRTVAEVLASRPGIASLALEAIHPLDEPAVTRILQSAEAVAVFEELEPVVELAVRGLASRLGWRGRIVGKLDGLLPRVGRYTREEILRGLRALEGGTEIPIAEAGTPAFKHPITFCAGCPHRGTYLALNRALKKLKLRREEVVVTGDIGCTILGMNPPFDSCWTEVSMGSSIGLAQGFLRAGLKKPLVATIGDSTFFHAGIPPLINAVQHRAELLVIVLDNGWTAMTGFQPNPGTRPGLQAGRRVDIEALLLALGLERVEKIDPFRQEQAVEALSRALQAAGVRAVIAERECALTAARREGRGEALRIEAQACTFCRTCLRETGCPALVLSVSAAKRVMAIDREQCTGCGLCATSCSFAAILPAE